MAEVASYKFSYKEVAEALVKQQGLKEGIWALTVEFGISASNIGPDKNDLKPAAFVPIMGFGLQKVEEETNLTFNASEISQKSKD